ncbi:glycine-rich domain-containing protein 2 [Iris pallida]|uniref:Glycine-rich domain-containing protein 2 n=1 Tax=Iris pallida TaxID=29817 RepID=A0AAX6IJW1_IRIPA|nr:glycine-rich domain-containing protein 2 [Iris pallida]
MITPTLSSQPESEMSFRSSDTNSDNLFSLPNGSSTSDTPDKIRISLDLVTAARRHLSFLRSSSPPASPRRSIRRYKQLWLPLIADLVESSPSAILLPPPDVRWVWHCHCLHSPVGYREYCASRFGTAIERPAILDEENEDYALGRCRDAWDERYPSEPFDLEADGGDGGGGGEEEEEEGEIGVAVEKYMALRLYFADGFVSETVYLVAARRRYLDFLYLVRKFGDGSFRMVPASDVLLIWLTHKSFPLCYAKDLEEIGDLEGKVVGFGMGASEEEMEETRRVWEEAFDEPYERAGCLFNPLASPSRVLFNWETSDTDVNRAYKGLQPRFLMEVYVFLKGNWQDRETKNATKTFLRLRTVRCHRELKLDKPVSTLSSETWRKTWHLYCEFSTRGILIEVRQLGSTCLGNSKLMKRSSLLWNDILRSTSLTLTTELDMQMRAMVSITPPIQAPYLLKCVPDRVTDDKGAMISDVILRLNLYRPQEGRWLSRTVLDHTGRECFVIRTRVARGIWRRGAETLSALKWEDRITEIREGSWSYVANSVGSAPEKVIGTATPKREDSQEKKVLWCLSTGDILTIQWEHGLNFQLENEISTEPVKLLRGRQLQYKLTKDSSANRKEDEEDQFVTLVRFSPEYPDGKATALLNWKLLAVEFLPEEDALLVLLLCTAIARTISEISKEDVSGLLIRRRVREVKAGLRDWGSVMLPSPPPPSSSLPSQLQPWYWNAAEVLAAAEVADQRDLTHRYSPADGKDVLYKHSIIT